MPLPKEHYQSARVNKRLKSLEQRLDELEKSISALQARAVKKVEEKQKKDLT
jgi:uncharacterized protein with PhoU and TrkA domain